MTNLQPSRRIWYTCRAFCLRIRGASRVLTMPKDLFASLQAQNKAYPDLVRAMKASLEGVVDVAQLGARFEAASAFLAPIAPAGSAMLTRITPQIVFSNAAAFDVDKNTDKTPTRTIS
ncbi:unnamed protein product [Amoebophrya sp. A25]|nr:unnamed protein product [Amoebophrya sp. A25]|eukprot:GSA25T00021110001.1